MRMMQKMRSEAWIGLMSWLSHANDPNDAISRPWQAQRETCVFCSIVSIICITRLLRRSPDFCDISDYLFRKVGTSYTVIHQSRTWSSRDILAVPRAGSGVSTLTCRQSTPGSQAPLASWARLAGLTGTRWRSLERRTTYLRAARLACISSKQTTSRLVRVDKPPAADGSRDRDSVVQHGRGKVLEQESLRDFRTSRWSIWRCGDEGAAGRMVSGEAFARFCLALPCATTHQHSSEHRD